MKSALMQKDQEYKVLKEEKIQSYENQLEEVLTKQAHMSEENNK